MAWWTLRCLQLKGKVRAGSEEFVVTPPEVIHTVRGKSIGRREDEGRTPEGRQHVATGQRSCPLRQQGGNSQRGLTRTGVHQAVPELGGREFVEDVTGTVRCSREAQRELSKAVLSAVTADSKFALIRPVPALCVQLDSALQP